MNKRLLYLSALLTSTLSFGQNTPVSQSVETKTAVLEEFTGIHCGYCPDGHKIANGLATSNPGKVVLINIHSGGYAVPAGNELDLRTAEGNSINSWTNVSGYPAGTVQRTDVSGELAVSRGSWTSLVNGVLAENAPVNIALDASIDASTRVVTVNVEIFYTSPFTSGTNHYLNVGILQDSIEGTQSGATTFFPQNILPNGNYLHNHVFRGFVNTGSINGDQIDASSTGVITKTYTYTLPSNIKGVDLELKNLKFFAFIGQGLYTPTTSKIYNAAEVEPVVTTASIPSAQLKSISSDLNIACETSATIAPTVDVYNLGTEITAITFEAQVNSESPVTYNWVGSIGTLQTKTITIPNIPAFTPASANNRVKVTIKSVEGGNGQIISADNLTANILKAKEVVGYDFTVEIYTDDYPEETSWEILNSSNAVVASGGSYQGNGQSSGGADALTVKTHNIQLDASDCYSFKLYDSYGDGLNEGTNPSGNFGWKIKKGNQTLYYKTSTSYGMTGSGSGTYFDLVDGVLSLTTTAGINEAENKMKLEVYPNPASSELNVTFEADNSDYSIVINDIAGRVVYSQELANLNGSQLVKLPVQSLGSGNYVLTIQSAKGMVNKHFVVE